MSFNDCYSNSEKADGTSHAQARVLKGSIAAATLRGRGAYVGHDDSSMIDLEIRLEIGTCEYIIIIITILFLVIRSTVFKPWNGILTDWFIPQQQSHNQCKKKSASACMVRVSFCFSRSRFRIRTLTWRSARNP